MAEGRFSRMAGAMPVASETAKRQQEATSAINLRTAAYGAATAQQSAQGARLAASQLGGQATLEQGKMALQRQQQEQEMQARLQQQQIQERQRKNQEKAAETRIGALQQQRNYDQRLAQLDSKAKDTLIDRETKFQNDQFGRTVWTERQLFDLALSQQASQQQLERFAADIRRADANYEQMLKIANSRIQQEEQRIQSLKQDAKTQAYAKELALLRSNLDKKIRNRAIKAKNRASMISGIFSVAGAVVGAYFGGPGGYAAGAAAGSAVGGGLGSMYASQTGGEESY